MAYYLMLVRCSTNTITAMLVLLNLIIAVMGVATANRLKPP
jgi:hypothetical protein